MEKTITEIASALIEKPKGILAADESLPTAEKRLASIGLPTSEENRRKYRELLLATPDIEQYISGVILFEETLRDHTADGTPFPKLLESKGIIPGIKVDQGTEPLTEGSPEKRTKGLAGLAERLEAYKQLGAQFTKWRGVYLIGEGMPTEAAITENATALARYAKTVQDHGMVPIVEPEVLMDGNHTVERCEEVTTNVLTAVFAALKEQGIDFSGMILKPNMVVSGKDCGDQATAEEVAAMTVRTLRATVPHEVPGVAFLSGGQPEPEATARLNAMNQLNNLPWRLTYSFSRALMGSALQTWQGKDEQWELARQVFLHRAKLVSAASTGGYNPDMEVNS